MRLFVIGIACAGKTTVARYLRECSDLNVVDMDDAIGRLNGGVWNEQWFEHEQSVKRELRHDDVFDHVLSGEQSVVSVAEEILLLAEDRRTS